MRKLTVTFFRNQNPISLLRIVVLGRDAIELPCDRKCYNQIFLEFCGKFWKPVCILALYAYLNQILFFWCSLLYPPFCCPWENSHRRCLNFHYQKDKSGASVFFYYKQYPRIYLQSVKNNLSPSAMLLNLNPALNDIYTGITAGCLSPALCP